MRRRSVLAVVVVRVPSDILRSFLGRVGGHLSLFGLVVVYFGAGRLLLVTGGCLFTIEVEFQLQTGVAACVLLLGFISFWSVFRSMLVS